MVSEPLVSIGVPVRNGAEFLEGALENLINQTYRNLEIVISDNNSEDGSLTISQKYSDIDSRVRVYTHPRTLTASDNFLFVLQKSRGDFFMWAAHDDRRSRNYVECLLRALRDNPAAVLTFSDVSIFSDHSAWERAPTAKHSFEQLARGTPLYRKVYTNVNTLCYHIYGLMRREVLNSYTWPTIDYGPDRVLLFYLAERGDFVKAQGARFYYYKSNVPKSRERRAIDNSLSKARNFPNVRLSKLCAEQISCAARPLPKGICSIYAFSLFLTLRSWRALVKLARKLF